MSSAHPSGALPVSSLRAGDGRRNEAACEVCDDGTADETDTCAACHGQKGEGTVGPNFTDEYWIHGGGIKNIFKTIKYGVPEKGMISWQSQLKPSDMQKVGSYILTLKGTNPPNPKAPQGTIWSDEAQPQPDSVAIQQATVPGSK